MLELGELIVAATLVQAMALSLLLVLLPLRARRYRRKPRPMTWRFGAYFTALRLAFLFIPLPQLPTPPLLPRLSPPSSLPRIRYAQPQAEPLV